jgi:hypothetical protein
MRVLTVCLPPPPQGARARPQRLDDSAGKRVCRRGRKRDCRSELLEVSIPSSQQLVSAV